MAIETRFLNDDIVRIPLYVPDAAGNPSGEKQRTVVLFWGDSVRIRGKHRGQDVAEFTQRMWSEAEGKYKNVKYAGLMPKKTTYRDAAVLKVRFVDIGQGDGALVETPKGQIVFIDGGEGAEMRRY